MREPGEVLHSLRDNISEKVSIVYTNHSELEQDTVSVENFISSLADEDVVQKLLEEDLRTLAKAFEIVRRYETTQQTARAVTQLMQPSLCNSAEPEQQQYVNMLTLQCGKLLSPVPQQKGCQDSSSSGWWRTNQEKQPFTLPAKITWALQFDSHF